MKTLNVIASVAKQSKRAAICAALICVATFAQAASIDWQSGAIYIASDAKGTTSTDTKANTTRLVTMYVYALSAEDYAAAQSMDTLALYEKYSTTEATVSKSSNGKGVATVAQPVADGSGKNYALILFVDEKNTNLADGAKFVKATLATANVEGSAGPTMSNMISSSLTSNWVSTATSSGGESGNVPEPTSGLLLLVGMGALALRRKRA